MKLVKALIAAGIVTGMAACATQSPPDGGPRDQTPPKLVSSNPKDQQLNVDTRTITLEFDEEVQQNTLNKQLLITPNINNPYKVLTDKNVMTLEFEKPLEDSTTYTFNFREGITDITEKNKAQGLRLSFSTGSYIDSSSVRGTVVNLMKQTPEKGALVLLYQAEDTLSVRKNRPYYLTSADDQGNYSLENVKEGNYLMYALVDKNNNSFYDSEEERIAYLAKPIRITPATDTVKLQTVRIDTKKPILLTRGKFIDRFVASYNEGIQGFTAMSVAGKDTLLGKPTVDGKSVELFKTERFNGGKAILAAVDSAGNIATDTLEIAFEGKPSSRVKGAAVKVINTGKSGGYKVGEEVVVELQKPIRITGAAPLKLLADSVVVQEIKYPEEVSLDRTNTELRFNMPKLSSNIRQVTVVLDSIAIQPLQGGPITFPQLQLGIMEGNKGTGSLSGTTTTDYTAYTLQLLNSEYKVVEERSAGKTFRFRNIAPGNYYIRVLIDENKNGKWDKADPKFERVPEPVYIHPNSIEVRANWEVENLELKF
ncbi:Ig-like domain-containing domain [Pontibacter anaerobius]|uniref:Ig-like domain-containing protein n=1 Tax=Pontibacter anaerobius TaxID=2993940 RepID=A0ABT3RGE7_9BACT|nr:Ig-like domain-containing protein [Pontibacter anaerobius]MCX2740566.1 Ig-like domain-containing protein [Pontibacter anaerobius]